MLVSVGKGMTCYLLTVIQESLALKHLTMAIDLTQLPIIGHRHTAVVKQIAIKTFIDRAMREEEGHLSLELPRLHKRFL